MAKKTFTKKRNAVVCGVCDGAGSYRPHYGAPYDSKTCWKCFGRGWHGESENYETERDQREGWISEREGE